MRGYWIKQLSYLKEWMRLDAFRMIALTIQLLVDF